MKRTHLALAPCATVLVAMLIGSGVYAAAPAAADQVTVQQLQKEANDLDAEFSRLQATTNPDAERQLMQRHWGMMLDHLRSTRMTPGLGDRGCTDWMMMDQNVAGPATMGPGGSRGCGMLGHGMMDGGMMGNGSRDWRLSSSMTPDAYRRGMQAYMREMHQQMAAIAAEKDPTRQQVLIREHYDKMYRHVQMTRGMGWMWTSDDAAAMRADLSPSAQLTVKYCSQCHAAPPPSIHTQGEWLQVTARMRGHIYDRAAAWGGGVKVPGVAELERIEDYLATNAAKEH